MKMADHGPLGIGIMFDLDIHVDQDLWNAPDGAIIRDAYRMIIAIRNDAEVAIREAQKALGRVNVAETGGCCGG